MVLVTGGTGFIGRRIVHRLQAAGYTVRVLVRNKAAAREVFSEPAPLELVEGDVLDVLGLARALEGVNDVVHAAAVVSFWRREYKLMQEVNQTGTANLVNVALEAGLPGKLLLLSSSAALGRTQDGQTITEANKWKKSPLNSHYAYTKYLAEKELYRGIEEGLQGVILNPTVVLGDSDFSRSSGKMLARAVQGGKYYPPGVNGFVSLEDVARATLLALESDFVAGERFLLNATNLSYQEFFRLAAGAIGARVPRKPMPRAMIRRGARAAAFLSRLTGRPPLILPATAVTLTHKFFYDASRFKDSFGYTFQAAEDFIPAAAKACVKQQTS